MNGAERDNSGGWGSGEEEEEEGNGKWLVAPRETAAAEEGEREEVGNRKRIHGQRSLSESA